MVAGAIAGIAGIGLDLGTAGALILGIAFFLVSLACFVAWAMRIVARYRSEIESLFPSPPRGNL